MVGVHEKITGNFLVGPKQTPFVSTQVKNEKTGRDVDVIFSVPVSQLQLESVDLSCHAQPDLIVIS